MRLQMIQVGPRQIEVRSNKWSFTIDLKEQFGGRNSGPNPSDLIAAALGSCQVLTGIDWAARRHGIELSGIEAEFEWGNQGNPVPMDNINVTVRNVAKQLVDHKIVRAFRGVARSCTVTKTLQSQPKLTLQIE